MLESLVKQDLLPARRGLAISGDRRGFGSFRERIAWTARTGIPQEGQATESHGDLSIRLRNNEEPGRQELRLGRSNRIVRKRWQWGEEPSSFGLTNPTGFAGMSDMDMPANSGMHPETSGKRWPLSARAAKGGQEVRR